MWRYALYKEEKYSHDDYDENETDSPADDLVAVRGNEKLLGQSEITKGILDFLEVGIKYRINVDIKENKYCHEIEAVWGMLVEIRYSVQRGQSGRPI